MKSVPFLKLDEQTLTLKQVVRLSQSAGGWQRFLKEVLQQHILENELEARLYITLEELEVEQGIIDFRLQNKLTETEQFNNWLTKNELDYEDFKNRIIFALKVDKLKTEITASKLEEYFKEKQHDLSQVILSRLILSNHQLAEKLKQKLDEDGDTFPELAKEYSLTDDRETDGKVGPVRISNLPDSLKKALYSSQDGDMIGPLQIEGRYCLFRLEKFIPAALEGQLEKELQNQLFAQWVQDKLNKTDLQLVK